MLELTSYFFEYGHFNLHILFLLTFYKTFDGEASCVRRWKTLDFKHFTWIWIWRQLHNATKSLVRNTLRSNHRRCSVRKTVLRNFTTGLKHYWKRGSGTLNFVKFLRTSFLTENHWRISSEITSNWKNLRANFKQWY